MGDGVQQTRLAAILIADLVGYTQMVERDAEGTVLAWKRVRDAVTDPAIHHHGGRIVKLTGDGFLAEFPVVLNAVQCALAIQDDLIDDPMRFRLAVNLGDIIDDGEDIHGEGVNIAARIEPLADPGGVTISGGVYEQVRNRIDRKLTDLGEVSVKNVGAPIRVYKLSPRSGGSDRGHAPSQTPRSERPSVAVLPFNNMSGDPDQTYFADGITEDIITELSRNSWLTVIARNTTFRYKGVSVDIQQVAEKLNVRYVIEGSVRKSGPNLRINVQFLDGASGSHLWAEKYDRVLDDVFSVQDEIVGSIVHALSTADGVLELSERRKHRAGRQKTTSAYDLYLQGRDLFSQAVGFNYEAAETLFEQAIAQDDDFAQAHSALAWLLFLRFKMLRTETFDGIRQRAFDLATRAAQLDPEDYRAYLVLAFLFTHEGRHDRGIANFDRALQINPNDANVLIWSSESLTYTGHAAEALDRCEWAFRLNPNCPDFYHWLHGFALFHLGRYDEALATQLKMVSPRYSRLLLAATYAGLDRVEEAQREARDYLDLVPDFSVETWARTEFYSDPAELARYTEALRKAGLPD